MKLPDTFIREMGEMLGRFGRSGEVPDFLDAFQAAPVYGLRANTLKIAAPDLRRLLAGTCTLDEDTLPAVAWSDDGFYYPAGLQPGRLPLYLAGLYYIQEPSAMLPAMVLDARPGERVLDLCAAPGGKSCKIAAGLRGEGLLWANEISADRARALLRNIELTGCVNCLITRETPEKLAAAVSAAGPAGLFDKILVDAPCSGSGMFRRDPSAIASWQDYGSDHYTIMQRDILRAAWPMLRPGGRLVYSTCTFSLAENEEMVQWLLDTFPDSQIEPIDKQPGVSDGLPLTLAMRGTARIWPHLARGEGHFCAQIGKQPDNQPGSENARRADRQIPTAEAALTSEGTAAWQAFAAFCQENLSDIGRARIERLLAAGHARYEAQAMHILPPGLDLPPRLSKAKTGLYLGQIKLTGRGNVVYEPSQAFLFSLQAADLRYVVAGSAGSDLINRYLHGETLACPPNLALPAGKTVSGRYVAVLLAGADSESAAGQAWPIVHPNTWPLGWTKIQDGHWLKNLYPKAWRTMS